MLRTIVMCLLFSTLASASLMFIDRSPGEDNNVVAIEAAIQASRGSHVDIYLFDKLQSGASTPKTISTTTFTVGGHRMIGTWDVIDPVVTISYLTVKAGNEYALYEILPFANAGFWGNALITNKKGMPDGTWHYSLWTTQVLSNSNGVVGPPVPEPATYGLVLGALAVLYGTRRRLLTC
jgi:hypothetical protein